jgi:hypothetical protein
VHPSIYPPPIEGYRSQADMGRGEEAALNNEYSQAGSLSIKLNDSFPSAPFPAGPAFPAGVLAKVEAV